MVLKSAKFDVGEFDNSQFDVNVGTPIEWSIFDTGYGSSLGIVAQTFTIGTLNSNINYLVDTISLDIAAYENIQEALSGTITISVRAVDEDGKPTGADLAYYTGDVRDLLGAGKYPVFVLNNKLLLQSSTKYAIVVTGSEISYDNCGVFWEYSKIYDDGTDYPGGQAYNYSAGLWTELVFSGKSTDFSFAVYGTPILDNSETATLSDSVTRIAIHPNQTSSDTTTLTDSVVATAIYPKTSSDTVSIYDNTEQYAISNLINNLNFYWKLEEESGNPIDEMNNVSSTSTDITYRQTGKIGKCYSLNGTTSKVVSDFGSGLNPSTQPISFAMWVKPDSTANKIVASFGTGIGTNQRLYFGINSSGKWNMSIGATPWDTSGITATTEWQYILITMDGSTARMYVDNQLSKETSYSSFTTVGAFGLSQYPSYFFAGLTDEVGMWTRTLTEAERTLLYNSGLGLPYPFRVIRTMEDTATLSDEISREVIHPIQTKTETATLSDSIERNLFRPVNFSESVTLSDTTWVQKPDKEIPMQTDGIGLVEDFLYGDPYFNVHKISNIVDPAQIVGGATYVEGIVGNYALRFDGVNDYVYTPTMFNNPQSYSLSLWFKTTNASGKKLIGFESNRTGTSSAYDRHIYMGTDGKIKYGWWTGAQTTISSTDTLNDGNWHHVVATLQDGVGELFIDNVSQGTANGNAFNYTGYWRIGGGTNAWTSSASGSFDGDIDEVVVQQSSVVYHYSFEEGSGLVAINSAPNDTTTLSDSYSIERFSTIEQTDELSVTDNIDTNKEQLLTIVDTLELEDIYRFDNLFNYLDELGLSDDSEIIRVPFSLTRSDSDTATLSDSMTIYSERNQSVSDTALLAEFINLETIIGRASSDEVALSENLSISAYGARERGVSDTTNLSDSVSILRVGQASGIEGQDTIYINNDGTWILFDNYESFNIKKQQNQPSEFTITISDIDTQKSYFKEFAEIIFLNGSNLILKGRIQTIEYGSNYEVIARGYGMEGILLEKELTKLSEDDPKRVQYTNISAQTIAKELLASDPDDLGGDYIMPYASDGIFSTDYGETTMRYEYANRLNALGALANAIDYEWWVSQTYDDLYDVDTFNLARRKGTQTSVETFVTNGDDTNATRTSIEKDINSMANSVTVLGYGDGENQLEVNCYNASPIYTTLDENITETQTTISLVDASTFPSSGAINIMGEQITYVSKFGNTLQGCSARTYPHRKGVYVEKYEEFTNPAFGSSLYTYGVMETTQVDRSILDRETLELIASQYLLRHSLPIERIKIIPAEPTSCIDNVTIGDMVTIVDDESDIDGDYRIVGITYSDQYGFLDMEIEVSNVSLEFIAQMQKERQNQQNLQKYMQGATNIYAVNTAENCDSSTPLNLRFYIPEDAVAINKVTLNFKPQKYRGHTSVAEVNSDNSIVSSAQNSAMSFTLSNNGNYSTIQSFTTPSQDCDGGHFYLSVSPSIFDTEQVTGSPSTRNMLVVYLTDGTIDYPVYSRFGGSIYSNQLSGSLSFSCFVPGNIKSKTFSFRAGIQGETLPSHTFSFGGHSGYYALSRHNHFIGHQISFDDFPTTSLSISAGQDGSETPLVTTGIVSEGQSIEVDLTDRVSSVGAGNWFNVKILPSAGNMRIEGDVHIKLFIESNI